MAQADGTILINTEIDADGMKAGSKEVEAAVRRMASSIDNLSTKAKNSLNKQVNSFAKLNSEYAAQAKKVEQLKSKVSEYAKQKIPTAEYSEIQLQIEKAREKLDRLTASQEKFISMGGKQTSSTFKRYQYDIDELANTIKYAEGELRDLEETGKAFSYGVNTKQAQADMEKLASAERRLSDMNNRLGTSYSSIKGTVNDYKNNLLKASDAQNKASNTGKNLSKSLKDTGNSAKSAQFGLAKMLGMSVLYSLTFQAISAVTSGIKEGFTNLAKYSGSTNQSISMLWSSLERLKNSLATAFAPILDVVAPILSKFIDMISTAASYVSMFFAFLSGKSTYTRAVAVQKDYAASLQDTSSSAGDLADSTADDAKATEEATEAAEDYLSPLDDINKYNEQNSGSGSGTPGAGSGGKPGSGIGGGTGEGPLFEEVEISNEFSDLMDTILDKLKQVKDIFMSGFWKGLGDYKPILNELKKDLSSIKGYVYDIFSDSGVQEAASRFAASFIYNLGVVAGSFASIGLTIAANIVGGIESYLSRNTERIKGFLISMFNIGADIFDQIGLSAQTIAEIFSSVFSSQLAQDLTGNIIGIFSSIGMTAMEVIGRVIRDSIYLLTQPFIDNKELIKEAILNTMAPIQELAQKFEDFLNQTGEKLIKFYDEKIKPFVDSISSGVGEIIGAILEMYNEYIVPILERWGDKLGQLMDGPISTFVDKFLEVAGKIIDAIKEIWEEVLVPAIDWVVRTIIPVIAPIIENLGNAVIQVAEIIFNAVSFIIDIIGGIIDFLAGVFTGDWTRAWNGIIEILNLVINAINSMINKLNGLHFSTPDWLPFGLGGREFGFNLKTIPNIPYLASGAVIPPNKEFLAVLGDQKSGNNIEAPEGLIRRIVREETGSGNNKYEVVAKVGRKELFRMMIDEGKLQQQQTGKNPFEFA